MSVIVISESNFEKEVMESDRTVLLDFWAPLSGLCSELLPNVEAVACEKPQVKVGKINVAEEPALAERFGVSTVPTLIVIKGGQVVEQAVGAVPRAAILAMLG